MSFSGADKDVQDIPLDFSADSYADINDDVNELTTACTGALLVNLFRTMLLPKV